MRAALQLYAGPSLYKFNSTESWSDSRDFNWLMNIHIYIHVCKVDSVGIGSDFPKSILTKGYFRLNHMTESRDAPVSRSVIKFNAGCGGTSKLITQKDRHVPHAGNSSCTEYMYMYLDTLKLQQS